MEVYTGKQLLESFGSLSKSLDALDHIAKGEVRCETCNGAGWHQPSNSIIEGPPPIREEGI